LAPPPSAHAKTAPYSPRNPPPKSHTHPPGTGRRTHGGGALKGASLRVTATRSTDARSTDTSRLEPAEMNGGVAGLSGSLALVLLLPIGAGAPVPWPADLVMFTVGGRD